MKIKDFVTCQTASGRILYAREGQLKPYGEQDTNTLCGFKAAWDTAVELNMVLHGYTDCCPICRARLLELLDEPIARPFYWNKNRENA